MKGRIFSDARVFGPVAIALVAIVIAAQMLEWLINRVWRPDLVEWEWISEVFVVAAFGVVTTLWRRLHVARMEIAGLERERLTIQAELGVAARVQRALLPPIPDRMNGIDWHAVMEPAGSVGGDYYDLFPVSAGRMCVVLADVSGKGVPAAVFVSNMRAVLRAVARDEAAPSRILAEVSEILLVDGGGELYVTCFAAIVDTQGRTLAYANAGHPPGVVLGALGKTQSLVAGGPPLGLLPGARYEEESLALAPGDLVVLVSDGITEALDAGGVDIPRALAERLAAVQRTPVAVCDALLAATEGSAGPAGVASWSDDRTVVAFAVAPEVTATQD